MLERIRKIYRKEIDPKVVKSGWDIMKLELSNNFPNLDIERYNEPLEDWFKIRTIFSLPISTIEKIDILRTSRDFEFKYNEIIDNDDFIKALSYITNKLGKKEESFERK